MGEARIRQINEGKIVKFNMEGPDILGLTDVPVAKRQLIVNILAGIVRAAFPGGMDRHDGRIWAAYQESLLDTDLTEFDVTLKMVEWLSKAVENETLKLDPSLAQPREALASYLEQLRDVAKGTGRDLVIPSVQVSREELRKTYPDMEPAAGPLE